MESSIELAWYEISFAKPDLLYYCSSPRPGAHHPGDHDSGGWGRGGGGGGGVVGTLRWTSISSKGNSNIPGRFMVPKSELSAGLMGHLTRKQTYPLP